MYKIYIHTAPNGKKYVGQTRQSVDRRWRNGEGYANNKYFYRAILKYGWENFSHEIICTCPDQKSANKREAELIKEFKSNDPAYGYNVSGGADGRGLVAESTRALMSEKMKGRFAGENNPNYGRKHTPEEREKISKHNRGYFLGEKSPLYGTHPSEETRWKMSKARKQSEAARRCIEQLNKSKAKRVLCVETNTVYESAHQAARETGFGQGNISSACRGVYLQAYGFHWEYL